MKVGLFGGSFDPVHRAHLEIARAARRDLGLDRILFLPTAVPPHKRDRDQAPALARFAMVELALLEEHRLFASGFELGPDDPSYTVESLEHFRDLWPRAELHLLLGSDSLAEISTWHRWRELPGLARLVVYPRRGAGREEILESARPEILDALDRERILFLDHREWEISSTRIREALKRGDDPPEGWVPPRVLHYMRKYHLYDEGSSPLGNP
ncbi:MAG: nicotinate (nicotinamide) nucleotide adenylyltransferase [Thermoanaerobaculia bacterium]|nr:nicotinate (nicotinamide) nucleotide adenylyltransferase [Thermoanaerobaculia bacterium]